MSKVVFLLPSGVSAFLTGVGVVALCTIAADGWRVIARPTPPTAADWACGQDLTVAGIALTASSLPFLGAEAGLLGTLVGALFGVLIAITGATHRGWVQDSGEWRLKRSTAVWTSAAGGAALTAAWFISFYQMPLTMFWKGLLPWL